MIQTLEGREKVIPHKIANKVNELIEEIEELEDKIKKLEGKITENKSSIDRIEEDEN